MSQNNRKQKRRSVDSDSSLPFTKTNYLIFFVALVFVIAGYIALGQGPWDSFASLTLAPVLLIISYLVLMPAAILYRKKEKVAVSSENLEE